ncbi:hypothetical protein NDU88_005680 [Pleurodeles waltl]|uniref:Uncharacterized protein n=1 Tax=Pleurodeles waltl TaxID=8319 RepID=A0AAV7WB78_PLEWA|nr:hypothetical protein NDU88_005680 [Pleurodeles waltl]
MPHAVDPSQHPQRSAGRGEGPQRLSAPADATTVNYHISRRGNLVYSAVARAHGLPAAAQPCIGWAHLRAGPSATMPPRRGGRVSRRSGDHLLQPWAPSPGPSFRGPVRMLLCPVRSLDATISWRQSLSAVQGATPAGCRCGRRSRRTAATAQHSEQRRPPARSSCFL